MIILKSENSWGGESALMGPYFDADGVFPSASKSYPTNSARIGRNLVFLSFTVTEWCWNTSNIAIKYASSDTTECENAITSSMMQADPGSPF